MRETTSPAIVDVDPSWSTLTPLAQRVADNPNQIAIERSVGGGESWKAMTIAEFDAAVRDVARGLIARGVGAGDRVGLMARTSYEWTLLDYAIWSAGAITVPIYETSSADQVQWICADSNVSLLIVESSEYAVIAEDASAELDSLTDILIIDHGAVNALTEAGHNVPAEDVDARRAGVTTASVATLIYTSGTTGRPKGVELTHGAFLSLVLNGANDLAEIVMGDDKRTLIFLPLAHVFARFLQVLAITNGNVLGHANDLKRLVQNMESFKPTYLLAVPRVFEKVYNSAAQKSGQGLKKKIFVWAVRVAISYSRALDSTSGPGLGLRIQHWLAGKVVYSKLQALFGGNLGYAISGGAPLGERLGHFYRGIGLVILEGYGLTETTAPLTVNRPDKVKIGTVGPPLASVSVRISDDGEILAKAPSVFSGYHNNPEATQAAFEDGWFRTGDLGSIDEDGYVSITGRIKELIVTAGGKNVSPSTLEDPIRAYSIVSQCVVVGDQRPFIAALITLDAEMLPGWLANKGLEPMTVAEAKNHPDVIAAIQTTVDRANSKVSRPESIRKFTILSTDLTVDNGYLTPSLKVRRAQVLNDFAAEIDDLYASTSDVTEKA